MLIDLEFKALARHFFILIHPFLRLAMFGEWCHEVKIITSAEETETTHHSFNFLLLLHSL